MSKKKVDWPHIENPPKKPYRLKIRYESGYERVLGLTEDAAKTIGRHLAKNDYDPSYLTFVQDPDEVPEVVRIYLKQVEEIAIEKNKPSAHDCS
jgi:hypothetical protein